MRILGLDLGIASCGWAVVELEGERGALLGAGARCFDAPLVDKTGEPKSAERRAARGQRRVVRRRAQRMNAIRNLLATQGLLPDAANDALFEAHRRAGDPWKLRAAAFDRRLTPDEFAVVVGHIARHRGFRSNSKRDAGANAADETSKMKKAIEATREHLAKYRSFGEMLAQDPQFAERKRNRDKDFSHTPLRSDLEAELRSIFAAQRRFGNDGATADFENNVGAAAFNQRELQDSEAKVGACPFEPEEKRTTKYAPSFERFRFLSRLAQLRIGKAERALSPDEIAAAERAFGETKGISFIRLRKLLDLDPSTRFAGVPSDKEGQDVAARNGACAVGTRALREALGEPLWQTLGRTPERLDRIAEILAFREDLQRIRLGLQEIGLEPLALSRLIEATEQGAFNAFAGAAHISARAARNIVPGLRDGLVYSDACAQAGYDHTARRLVSLKDINSPVTRRAFGEAIKQVRAVAHAYKTIDYVHIELARAVGKSAEERRKLTDGLEARTAQKERNRALAAEILGRPVGDNELLRYELATEQAFKCVYCFGDIAPDGFRDNDARCQVDHILPWSRFGDDSFPNKTLACARCNQEKRGRTPYEWFEADKDAAAWERFTAAFDTLKQIRPFKKRKFLLKNAKEVEDKFQQRNLNDTQWASRLLADELKRMFPAPEGQRRVYARPGAITSKLRRAWGLEETKKHDGKRLSDDRHHAVDAIVLAVTTEGLLQHMTRQVQQREREGRADDIYHIAPPWRHFREDVLRVVYGENGADGVFVSRAERRRARGKAHDATVKQVREVDGETTVYVRKRVEDLKEADLDKIPVPAPYGKIVDPRKLRDELVETLRAWIAAGKPKDNPPLSPKGDRIGKVRIAVKDKIGVLIPRNDGSTVDRGDMARVDVFRKQSKKGKWEFYLVPIYPHEIATLETPPMRAIVAYKPETDWTRIDESFEFLWPLYQRDWVEVVKASGEVVSGYFSGCHRGTGAINLFAHFSAERSTDGIGAKTLSQFKKFVVDRLGRVSEVERELRTWRGKVCI